MVLLESLEAFFEELDAMFAQCKERGAGTVYITLKKVEDSSSSTSSTKNANGNTVVNGGKRAGGRREGWLARAKISNKKTRKISFLVRVLLVSCSVRECV